MSEPVDCGAAPTPKCLASAIFKLAKTLPDDSYFRRHVAFAERELAPGSIQVALDYVHADTPDPPLWYDIKRVAEAGRFDRAIELARQRSSALERLGGLLSVAAHMAEKEPPARAIQLVDEVEQALSSLDADERVDLRKLILHEVGRLRAMLGQIDRAAQLFKGGGASSVGALLYLAEAYPAAASLREAAWQETERANEAYAWLLMLHDASKRGQSELSQAVSRIGDRLYDKSSSDRVMNAVPLARLLSTAGLPEQAAKMIESWPEWIHGQRPVEQLNILRIVIPALVELGRDQDVERAVHAMDAPRERTECLGIAATSYFRFGRTDRAVRSDREALLVAQDAPRASPSDKVERNSILENLALMRASRGDVEGALDVVAKISDDARMRDVTYDVVRRAIDQGNAAVARPAIEELQRQARAAPDVRILLEVARAWLDVDNEQDARRALDEAIKLATERPVALDGYQATLAAKLKWRTEGHSYPRAILEFLDRFDVKDSAAIDHLVEVMTPISPAVAIQLAGRQTETERQIDELAVVGLTIAEAAK
ncbi:hypothetical protein ACQR1I_16125 [Bradyrhizobium sp. HKCCYLS2038]|uniref:hypothetical protein n=1 Tax=unclassified Bradyrhizobium TaxID=2631580 RepID=UPI003EB765B5